MVRKGGCGKVKKAPHSALIIKAEGRLGKPATSLGCALDSTASLLWVAQSSNKNFKFSCVAFYSTRAQSFSDKSAILAWRKDYFCHTKAGSLIQTVSCRLKSWFSDESAKKVIQFFHSIASNNRNKFWMFQLFPHCSSFQFCLASSKSLWCCTWSENCPQEGEIWSRLVDNFALPRSSSFPLLCVSLPNALVLADCTFLPLLQGFHLDANGTLLILILGLDEEAIGKSLSWDTLWKLTLVPKGQDFCCSNRQTKTKKQQKGGVF